mgnify:CR=1 FL=1
MNESEKLNMSYKSSTSASATFNFQADLAVTCFDDDFSVEVEQSVLQINQNGTDVYASFEALIVLIDLKDPKNKAFVRLDVRQFRLFSLEKNYKFTASSDNALVEKITSEDEEVRRRFFDVIDDWIEFELHVYAAD